MIHVVPNSASYSSSSVADFVCLTAAVFFLEYEVSKMVSG